MRDMHTDRTRGSSLDHSSSLENAPKAVEFFTDAPLFATDAQTGFQTRMQFLTAQGAHIRNLAFGSSERYLAFIDISHYGAVNLFFPRSVGDEYKRKFAEIAEQYFPKLSVAGNGDSKYLVDPKISLGSDEFCIEFSKSNDNLTRFSNFIDQVSQMRTELLAAQPNDRVAALEQFAAFRNQVKRITGRSFDNIGLGTSQLEAFRDHLVDLISDIKGRDIMDFNERPLHDLCVIAANCVAENAAESEQRVSPLVACHALLDLNGEMDPLRYHLALGAADFFVHTLKGLGPNAHDVSKVFPINLREFASAEEPSIEVSFGDRSKVIKVRSEVHDEIAAMQVQLDSFNRVFSEYGTTELKENQRQELTKLLLEDPGLPGAIKFELALNQQVAEFVDLPDGELTWFEVDVDGFGSLNEESYVNGNIARTTLKDALNYTFKPIILVGRGGRFVGLSTESVNRNRLSELHTDLDTGIAQCVTTRAKIDHSGRQALNLQSGQESTLARPHAKLRVGKIIASNISTVEELFSPSSSQLERVATYKPATSVS